MADTPQSKDLKKLEYMFGIILVVFFGAALILAIDMQIKHAILRASERAWEGIDALKRDTRGTSAPANSNGSVNSGFRGDDGARVEMATVDKPDQGRMAEGPAGTNGQAKPSPRAGNKRIQGPDKPVVS